MTVVNIEPLLKHKTLIKNIGRSSILSLERVYVKSGVATTTDMDIQVSVPTTLEDGLYYNEGFDVGLYIKSKDDIDKFPIMDVEGDNLGDVALDAHGIRAMDFVSKFMSAEETRYYLNGICFYEGSMVATNGHGLNLVKIDTLIESNPIIPRKAVNMIKSLFKETRANSALITFCASKFCAEIAGCKIVGKLIDGTFPDISRVIPVYEEGDKKGDIDISEIINIMPQLKAVSKMNGSKYPSIKIEDRKIYPANDHIGTGVSWNTNLDIRAGLNANYIKNLCSGAYLYRDESSPFLINGNEFDGQISVLMPLRVF